jgi:hypothetical protein
MSFDVLDFRVAIQKGAQFRSRPGIKEDVLRVHEHAADPLFRVDQVLHANGPGRLAERLAVGIFAAQAEDIPTGQREDAIRDRRQRHRTLKLRVHDSFIFNSDNASRLSGTGQTFVKML